MNILIFGPQGSGKGTQAEKLSEKYGLAHIETGQIFRDIAGEDSPLGRQIKELNENKEMIPDEITVAVLRSYLDKVPAGQGVILDSAPRTQGQIQPVEDMLAALGRNIDKAVYISLPFAESFARITRRYNCVDCKKTLVLGRDIQTLEDKCPDCEGEIMQRGDDTPDGITKRLNVFYEVTIPVVEHYRKRGMLVEVDGNQGVEKVFEEIIAKL